MVSDAISSVSVVVDWFRSVSMDDSGVEDLLVGVEGGEFGSGVGAPVACTFVNNLSASVDRPLCTVPMILLQCYCKWL